MDESKVFEAYLALPDGYEAQLMVLRDYPGGRAKRGLKMSIYRSRVWIGHVSEPEPLTYRSQEHPDVQVATDACYSALLAGARTAVNSLAAIAAIEDRVHSYFAGTSQAV